MCGCALSVMLLTLAVALPTPHDYSGTFQGGYSARLQPQGGLLREQEGFCALQKQLKRIRCVCGVFLRASSSLLQVSLVRWGAMPPLIIVCIMAVLFLFIGVITCVDRQASKRRIQVYSWTVVCLLVVTVYGLFAVRTHHTGADLVSVL